MKRTKLQLSDEADLSILEEKTIAFIGYGNQGRSQALNMRDTIIAHDLRIEVIIGNIQDEYWKRAQKDGFEVCSIAEACEKGDIIFFLIPDEIMSQVYEQNIKSHLKRDDVLNFASGYNITYQLIEPPPFVDVIMIGPRMGGKEVRDLYVINKGFPSFIAVHQDASGLAKNITLALANTIGSTINIEVTFEQETFSDLLSEQALSPIITQAFIAKYETDLKYGIPPEAALFELYLSGEWAQDFKRMAEMGMLKQLPLHSMTSQYGQLTRANEFDDAEIKAFMETQAKKIKEGTFAKELALEQKKGYPTLKRLYRLSSQHPMIKKEQEILKKLRKNR